MLAPLDNETIFKKVFTDHEVFQQFVKDLFGIDITVSKIETEKQFSPPIANINFKLDIFAETDDHRFVIEIQKIDYDHNFNRFLNYFASLIIEQQKRGEKYEIPQAVLGVVVISRPYKIDQLTGSPIRASVMSIDLNPRDLSDTVVQLWNHKLLFLNPHPRYHDPSTPPQYQDWLDLFRASIENNVSISLNLNNKGIAKATQIAEINNLDPDTLNQMHISSSKKLMLSIVENEGRQEGIIEGLIKGKIEGKMEGKMEEKLAAAEEGILAGLTNEVIKIMTKLNDGQIDEIRGRLKNSREEL